MRKYVTVEQIEKLWWSEAPFRNGSLGEQIAAYRARMGYVWKIVLQGCSHEKGVCGQWCLKPVVEEGTPNVTLEEVSAWPPILRPRRCESCTYLTLEAAQAAAEEWERRVNDSWKSFLND